MNDEQPQEQPTESDQPDELQEPGNSEQSADEPDENPSRREAKYRTQLRAAQAERDTIAEKLANMQRDTANTAIVAYGLKPAAVRSVTELGDVLAEDGTINTDAIKKACDNARTELGIDKPRKPVKSLHSGAAVPQERPNSWREAFSPRKER